MRVRLLIFLVAICHTTCVLSLIRGEYKWTIRHPDGAKNKLVGFVGEQRTLVVGIKGARDGHIVLTPEKDVTRNVFEYIVGGWGNRKTKLSLWGGLADNYIVLNQLHPKKYRYFWLDWSDGHSLKAGVGTNPNDVSTMTLSRGVYGVDSDINTGYIRPRFLSLSAFHNTVYYKVVKATNPCFVPIATYNRLIPTPCSHYKPRGVQLSTLYNPERKLSTTTYRTVGFVGGITSLLIQIKAPNYGHILLSGSSNDLTKNLYEYVIGGTANLDLKIYESICRATILGEVLADRLHYKPVLDENFYRWFWLDWSDGLVIKVGGGLIPGDSMTKYLETTLKLFPAAHPRFLSLSAFENTAKYIIHKEPNQCYLSLDEYNNREKCGKRPNKMKCLMRNCCWDSKDRFCYKKAHGEYYWSVNNPVANLNLRTYEAAGYVGGMTSLVIHVKGDRDGHVILSELRSHVSHRFLFEFVIGGWDDTGVVLRAQIFGHSLVERRDIKNILTSQHYSAFWLDWSDGVHIKVGGGTIPGTNQYLQTYLWKSTYKLNHLAVSAYNNFMEYKVYKAQNKCFQSKREYNVNRMKCGDNVNSSSECLKLGCCWDRNGFEKICYYP